ncbi:hypothetical protein TNCT_87271 [Trichonephila clavata]|uniref:Uncharacterized protein n=1 Tax=Trichonephila clavata TaxID=2740835 RepID=A0A8X6LIM7_TRICU|nr:hypothetical protein TNCT_87271 [Trichonephila clavata]
MGEKVQSMIGEINTNQEAPAWGVEEVIPSEAARKSGTAGGREGGKRREGRTGDCFSNQQDELSGGCSPSTPCQMQFEAVCVVPECV